MAPRSAVAGALALLLCLLLGACASTPQSNALLAEVPDAPLSPVRLDALPFFPQERYQCGPAALAMMLGATGVPVIPADLVPQVYVPERRGAFQVEMAAAARSHGRVAYRLAPSLRALLEEISAGRPVLVLQNLGLSWYPRWHFAVVKGHDLERGLLVLNSGTHENYEVPMRVFERTWQRADRWALLVLEPGDVPANAAPDAWFQALVELERRRPQAAAAGYEAGLARWPDDSGLLLGFANLRYAGGELEAAAALLRRLLEVHPAYAPGWNNLAQISLELGRPGEAERQAREALRLGGRYAGTYRQTLAEIQEARKSRAPSPAYTGSE